MSRIKRAGWQLKIRDLFSNPTVATLAPCLTRAEDARAQGPVRGVVPMTPIQRWFFNTHDGDLHHFNQAVLLCSRDRVDEEALRSVLRKLQQHHDMLRATFKTGRGLVDQVVAGDDLPVWLDVLDLGDLPDANQALERAVDEVHRGFDLASGPLMHAVLFRLRHDDRLLLVIHHLVVDGVSWRILLEDLQRGYRQQLRGEEIDLGPKTDSYHRWANHLQRYATSPEVLSDRSYWSAVNRSDVPALPRIAEGAGTNLYGDCQTVSGRLSIEDTTRLLTQTHQAYNTEINDLLLTALGHALNRWHGRDATLITLEGHGREPLDSQLDVSRTVGWFTCLYPFLLSIPAGDLGAQIRHVRRALRSIPHKGLGFGILNHLAPPEHRPDPCAPWRPRVSFNYLGRFEDGDDDLFAIAPESSGQPFSSRLARAHELDIGGIVVGGQLSLSIAFDPDRHRQATVEALLTDFEEKLLRIGEHCSNVRHAVPTAEEFTNPDLSMEDYDQIVRNL